jgi:dimethylhistidine N-methyltransferase
MSAQPANLAFDDLRPPLEDFCAAVIAGLARRPRSLSPKFFYDARGSELFDEITGLPEYYPTRTEIALLREHGAAMAALLGHDTLLIELGSGSDAKIRVLLDALRPRAYVPIDISREHLLRSARGIAGDHPGLAVHALCADYTRAFALPEAVRGLRRAAFYPGSSIGNFEPDQACALLRGVAELLGPDGRLLVGVDLKKAPVRLHAAYNDSQGVTARFNLNLLHRIRRELGADIDPAAFRHHAFYNGDAGRVEMHLIATRPQTVVVDARRFEFAEGDGIQTENSYKYAVDEFGALAAAAGFDTLRVWQDRERLFSVHCLVVAG